MAVPQVMANHGGNPDYRYVDVDNPS